ncbi:MAG: hypothetical protein M0Q01_02995 [Syntrophales bacterium]|jgi:hypothetical protein|nr:hypothetical protein [Syntrophales bacterium]
MMNNYDPHLCQPDECKSCGACCGLYNYADSSRESLTLRLRGRTKLFRHADKSPEGLQVFSRMIQATEDMARRYEVIYCCEYLGFLDPEEKRVGCLLHPLQNGGIDHRGVSFYGRELCDGHFCPSYHYISGEEKQALLNIIPDWYLFGLVITDIDLVKSYFQLISNGVYETPSPERFKDGLLREKALAFFDLKLSWPFRSAAVRRLGKYYFDGSQYMINHIDYEALGSERSGFDRIFLSLTSDFRSREDLRQAEDLIQSHLDAFIHAYQDNP